MIRSLLNKVCKVGAHSWAMRYESNIFGENDQIPPIIKLKFYENFVLASETYGQLAKKVSGKFVG
jgi:hypothetical protein